MDNPRRIYGDRDLALALRYERERIYSTGVDTEYYSLNRGVNVDPLYQEPNQDPGTWDFEKFHLIVAIEFQERDDETPSVRDEGFQKEADARCLVSLLEWQEVAPVGRRPKVGDVMYAHGRWFDVVKAEGGSKLVDLPDFVGYHLELKSRTKFLPDRKVD